MSFQRSRRLFILQMLLLIIACEAEEISNQQLELVIGVISYGEGKQTLERFAGFREYLGKKIRTIIQLEPAFNENIALERIKHGAWSLVFAPPGLAAIASADYQYLPIFPLELRTNLQSIFIVKKDSPLQQLKDIEGKTIALGVPGSATGYYLPLYRLYGLTLEQILFAPTPKTVLEWVAQGKAVAGALSTDEFNLYRRELEDNVEFRQLFTDPQKVPLGAVLIGPSVEIFHQELIIKCMREAPPTVVQDLKYVPYGQIPNYQEMITVVKRVQSITGELNSKPVRLF
jgi:phosphonate transport system substrate-binding protein